MQHFYWKFIIHINLPFFFSEHRSCIYRTQSNIYIWSFFAKIVPNMVLNTSQEYPWCLLRSRKKCGGCIYTDPLATNILQKWSMLQNKTNEDFYLLENERKINRKVSAVYSIKLSKTLSRFVWCGENKKN